jgi:hypothetical protein
MTMELALSILGVVITTGSLVYAIKTNQEKRGRDRLVREKLAGLAGNIESTRQSAKWADGHLNNISINARKLEPNETVSAIIGGAHTGARDIVAAERMLGNLLGDVLALQRGLFGTEEIRHPDRQ